MSTLLRNVRSQGQGRHRVDEPTLPFWTRFGLGRGAAHVSPSVLAPLFLFPEPAILSIDLFRPPEAKVAMGSALHDRLRARELDIRIKSVGDSEVGGADQEEAEFRLA